jgi:hypothetical protein
LTGAVGLRSLRLVWLGAALCLPVPCQTVLSGGPGGSLLIPTDLAVLEAQQPRRDLVCTVTPAKPLLGFDLRFHSGYDISIPLKELAGDENQLLILFRIQGLDKRNPPVYLTQKIHVPPIEDDAKGEATLQGAFDLGEGKYHVDWLMRDRTDRVCASFWDSDAILTAKDKQLPLTLQAGEVAEALEMQTYMEERVAPPKRTGEGLKVKMLVNFAPQNSRAASLQPTDTIALVSIMRTLERDPRIGKYSIVAFNLQEQKVLFRQASSDHIDYPGIGQSLKDLQLGRVDIGKLQKKNGETEFIGELIRQEIQSDGEQPDALIIAGPKAILPERVPAETLRHIGEPAYPVFYMNYNLYPQAVPWRDSIGDAVKSLKGQEYTISRPRDLWFAVSEIVSRIVRLKSGRRTTVSSSPVESHEVSTQ